ncbi:Uncharacterized protein FWK35_00005143 [Aphis craccivora]|uniref:Uncharacterized protein n=1 Tax=Aphis craccivora TaxID=307492 RepID=A0A6G0YVU1_APHCR|nr:Uncharacterized protein FWK35_00005143 [Aphis craccivora]
MFSECSSSITQTTNACESNEIQTNNYLKMNCTKASRVNTISTEKEHFIEQLIRYYEEGVGIIHIILYFDQTVDSPNDPNQYFCV